jgi:uncharacterized protein YjiK
MASISHTRGVSGRMRDAPTVTAKLIKVLDIDLDEPSDLVALPGGAFLVVGDLSAHAEILRVGGPRQTFELPSIPGKADLEAATYDPDTKMLYVVREKENALCQYTLDLTARPVGPKLFRKLPLKVRPDKANSGIEGIAILPAVLAPDGRKHMLFAQEKQPMKLYISGAEPAAGKLQEIVLGAAITDALDDIDALAVNPKSGHVFALSEASSTIVELALRQTPNGTAADLVQIIDLKKAERAEGLCFNGRGELFVSLENDKIIARVEMP